MHMKKQILRFVVASLIIGVAIASVISCSKTEQMKENNNGTITHFSPSQNMVEPTITGFIQRHSDFKAGYKAGGEDIKLGVANWTFEASANYEFKGDKEGLVDFTTDSLALIVDVYVGDDNEYYIAEADAMELYDDVVGFTSNAVAPENTELLMADLQVISVENGQAEMKVITVSGTKSPNPWVINNTDYWYPVMNNGKCGAYAPQYAGVKDASDRLREILNASQAGTYWTDVETLIDIFNYFTPCEDGTCFWEGSSTDCLDPTAMQNWQIQAQGVIDELQPEGKQRIDAYLGWGVFGEDIFHHYFDYITYGIPQGDPAD